MKFATVIVLLFAITANAQKTSPITDSAKTVVVPRQLTANDTVAALHKLFKARRQGGAIMTTSAIGGDFLLAGLESADEQNSKSYLQFGFGFYALFYGVVAAPIAAIGTHKLIDYSTKREAKVIAEWQNQHSLPRYVRRHLKTKFFN